MNSSSFRLVNETDKICLFANGDVVYVSHFPGGYIILIYRKHRGIAD